MKPTIMITRPIPHEVEAYLEAHCECRRWNKEEPMPRQLLLSQLNDVEGLLIAGGKIDQELLDHAPRLKIVSNISVGYNNMDLSAMKARKVMGTNTPDVLDETVADLVFGLILGAARRIPELDRHVKQGRWQKGEDEPFFGVDVHHATLGIIGMGRIGEAIARRAKFGFQMNVLYYNRSRKPDTEAILGVTYQSLNELLGSADFIVLMTPLTAETTHLIGRKEFQMMKPSAVFINASRGKTVDEAALIEALLNKQIHAAGLDVFDREPIDPHNPLLQMANVITLPHIGSATGKTRFDMAMLAATNLVCALKGQTPPNLINELR